MSAEALNLLAAKLGMRVSQRWEGSAADQAAYARKHGDSQTSRMFMGDDTDIQIASRVRMLMRDEMDHEAVVCAARDRICALWVEREALRAAMREACDLLAERQHGNPARSAGHNARLCLESALAALQSQAPPSPVEQKEG
jgi:hypothetical protein